MSDGDTIASGYIRSGKTPGKAVWFIFTPADTPLSLLVSDYGFTVALDIRVENGLSSNKKGGA